jgi:CDP-glycerol glycerophosphotransferase
VVVPIYNVEDYLGACLESIADQTFADLEVVLVDDGSPDTSGELAEDFARGREGWKVLHVENGGLGRARNIGLDAATADYVTFVDSDDLVPRDAYELMMHAIEGSGSDIVSGGVLRYDGARTRPSGLHRRAVPETRIATHVRAMPSLLYDTTAWNKIFRREFLVEHGLRFPEGVYYEDIPLTVPAHFLARSVDLIQEPVYLWRERQTAEQSITQRRAESRNLVDRMAAVSSVNDFLESTGEVEGKRLHDLKVLTLDMPLFLDVLHEGDAEFAQTLVRVFRDYLSDVDPAVVASLPPRRRLAYFLIEQGRTAELVQAHQLQLRDPRPPVVRRGVRLFVQLPFFGDESVGVPDAVYEVTRSQRLVTGIRDVRWNRTTLEVDGHAFIDGVPDLGPGTTLHRLQLRLVGAKAERRTVRARRIRRTDVTGRSKQRAVNYDGSGFLARIPASEVVLPAGKDAAEFELVAQVAAPAARRGSPVGNPEYSRALHPPRGWAPGGVLVVPGYRGKKMRVAARRAVAVVRDVGVDGEEVLVSLRGTPGRPLPDLYVHLRRLDASEGVTVRLERHGAEGVARIAAEHLDVTSRSLAERQWRLWVAEAEDDDPVDAAALVDALVTTASASEREAPRTLTVKGRYVGPLDVDPEPGPGRARLHGRLLQLRERGVTGAMLVDGPLRPELVDFAFTPAGLELHGDTGGLDLDRLVLISPADRLEVPVEVTGDVWRAFVPATGDPGLPSLRWLRPGRWTVVAAVPGETDPELGVHVSATAEAHLDDLGGEQVSVMLRTSPTHELGVVSDGGGSWRDRGAFNQRIARKVHYRVARRLPLADTVFFEAWKGRQYSDNPRAIYEELVRRGDGRRLVWAVEHHGVEVPDGVETVVVGSRDYYRALGRARWVVSNDSMPKHYVKREGSVYGQTWHGTPLKRIGFDIENLQMSNKNYLVQFAKEVAKWDALVSPNAYSTEIFRRAFRFDGPVLETGYPRNDVFHRPQDRAARTAAAAARLGLEPGKRVILYAPTWRDNQYDKSGRYQFAMKLDLERMYRRFKDEAVLLIRGHQLVADSVDTSMFGDFARNVSHYPDISDLYLVADVLVTDYSSVMYDFVNTGRPMLFFTHDLEAYRDDLRGFYIDFEAEAPGPLFAHTTDVIDALTDLDAVAARHAGRYDAFREKYASLEDGRAAARFVDQLLTDGS